MIETSVWPYLPVLERLALALALGLFIGTERERQGKEAGLRTFAFAALLGALGILLGRDFALLSMGLLGLLVVLLNVYTLRIDQGIELTTSAALLMTGYIGILAGLGHTLTPVALGVVTAALLAWKREMAGFTLHLSEEEVRSGILLGILAFVVYPALPAGTVGPYGLINPRAAWSTVILIAGIGLVNYILLKLYGTRGVTAAGFLGGLVNSSAAVAELASRDREASGALCAVTYQGVLLATAAMIVRNAVLLAILAPRALFPLLPAFVVMLLAGLGLSLTARQQPVGAIQLNLRSPFSIQSALKFGLVFLALELAGEGGQHLLGQTGFYAVSLVGGLASSASAVASAGLLAAHGTVSPRVAGVGAVLASLTSTLVNLPLAARVSGDRPLTRRLSWGLTLIVLLGIAGIFVVLPSSWIGD